MNQIFSYVLYSQAELQWSWQYAIVSLIGCIICVGLWLGYRNNRINDEKKKADKSEDEKKKQEDKQEQKAQENPAQMSERESKKWLSKIQKNRPGMMYKLKSVPTQHKENNNAKPW